ncbi:hypothetical protein JUNP406_1124 [Acinetobacter baumannii]|jgi:hypothetical protein
MCKANSFSLGVLPKHLNYGGRTKGGSQTGNKGTSTPEVSPFRPTVEKKGANEFPTHKTRILHIDFVFPVCDNRLAMWPACEE